MKGEMRIQIQQIKDGGLGFKYDRVGKEANLLTFPVRTTEPTLR